MRGWMAVLGPLTRLRSKGRDAVLLLRTAHPPTLQGPLHEHGIARRHLKAEAMSVYEGPIQDLIEELGRLPGIGPKSAQRLAFHLLQVDIADAERLANAIRAVKQKVRFCDRCFNVSELEECRICRDVRRDPTLLCVVEEPRDVLAIEKTNEFRGRYHVLGGAISPIDGIGPDQLRIRELVARIGTEDVTEVVLATNPNIEGEATASYVSRLLKTMEINVSRIASGLPVGGDLEYADEVTLGRAFAGRRAV
jgi:recombination protein RecR